MANSNNPTPAYYGILPAPVRYDKSLNPKAAIFYTEITALSNVHGYCFATNRYFAELYDVSPTTISKWVNGLKDRSHVRLEYVRLKDGTEERRIFPIADTPSKHQGGVASDARGGCTRRNHNTNTLSLLEEARDKIKKYVSEYPATIQSLRDATRNDFTDDKFWLMVEDWLRHNAENTILLQDPTKRINGGHQSLYKWLRLDKDFSQKPKLVKQRNDREELPDPDYITDGLNFDDLK